MDIWELAAFGFFTGFGTTMGAKIAEYMISTLIHSKREENRRKVRCADAGNP